MPAPRASFFESDRRAANTSRSVWRFIAEHSRAINSSGGSVSGVTSAA